MTWLSATTIFAWFEIAGFVVALGVAAFLWRRQTAAMLTLAIWGSRAALIVAVLIAAVGAPLFLYRFRHAQLGPEVVIPLERIHHSLAHAFIAAFVIFWPFLLVASIARPKSVPRKLLLGCLAVLTVLLFLFVSFTGYALPDGMPRDLSDREGLFAFRFVVLHVVLGPALAIGTLLLLLWRHSRAAGQRRQDHLPG